MTPGHPPGPAFDRMSAVGDSEMLAMLDRYDIVVSLTAVFEWSGYRYSSARDAIAAAKRATETGAT